MEVHGYLGTSEEALNQAGKEGGKVIGIEGSPWIKDSEMKACLAFHMAGHRVSECTGTAPTVGTGRADGEAGNYKVSSGWVHGSCAVCCGGRSGPAGQSTGLGHELLPPALDTVFPSPTRSCDPSPPCSVPLPLRVLTAGPLRVLSPPSHV